MSLIAEMLSYPFMVRAFVTGILVSLCSALLGVSLVLKRYSMIGDGLSHVSFGALSIAVALGMAPLKLALPVVILAAFFLLRITDNAKIKSDAAIAVVSASALAIGIIVTYVSKNSKDAMSYMFGSIVAIKQEDMIISILLSVVVIFLFLFCYHKIFAVTFDEEFARATGVKVSFYNTLLAVLTAVTIVIGMQMMGAMLMSCLIIFPALSSMRLFKSFRGVIISSGILSVICFCIGLVASYLCETPSGASIVVVNLIVFLLFAGIQAIKERFGL